MAGDPKANGYGILQTITSFYIY